MGAFLAHRRFFFLVIFAGLVRFAICNSVTTLIGSDQITRKKENANLFAFDFCFSPSFLVEIQGSAGGVLLSMAALLFRFVR